MVIETRWTNISNRQIIQDQSIQGLSCKCFKGETKELNKLSYGNSNLCYAETELHMYRIMQQTFEISGVFHLTIIKRLKKVEQSF